MSCTIAITGKGGVGKTTLAALLIRSLIARRRVPVLAVDADPNACLDQLLGVVARTTIGGVREQVRQLAERGMAAGIPKQAMLELKIAESLVEADDFDLIAMGRPEGPGCYCYANNVLKQVIAQLAGHYPFVVVDNEAGLENLSRRIVPSLDLLLLAADPSKQGLQTLRRLHGLAVEMGTRYGRLGILVNRLRGQQLPEEAERIRQEIGAEFAVGQPDDADVAQAAQAGESVFALAADNPVVVQIDRLVDALGIGSQRVCS